MTEANNKGRPRSPESSFIVAPLLLQRERTGNTTETLHPGISAVAVIRPPTRIGQGDLNAFYIRLLNAGILPVAQHIDRDGGDDNDRYFPTDHYREVGSSIFIPQSTHDRPRPSSNELQDLYSVLQSHQDTRPFISAMKAREKSVGTYFSGGLYVYDESSRILIYDYTELTRNYDTRSVREQITTETALDDLRRDRWSVIPLETQGVTIGGITRDIDFMISSPFKGKTGGTYMFVAAPLQQRLEDNDLLMQTGIHFLPVHEDEVLKGGCNIADLNRSRVLVCANREDAPTVFTQLADLAEARVVEAPRSFLDEGGGPRSSISSISIK